MIRIPKHKPPSRIRYEKSHPTIGFRLDRELKKRLENVLEGQSFADFVKEGLGVREREKKSLEEARDDGYSDGYEEAKNKFAVHAPCSTCGGDMIIQGEDTKKELAEFIVSHGYVHERCPEAKRE